MPLIRQSCGEIKVVNRIYYMNVWHCFITFMLKCCKFKLLDEYFLLRIVFFGVGFDVEFCLWLRKLYLLRIHLLLILTTLFGAGLIICIVTFLALRGPLVGLNAFVITLVLGSVFTLVLWWKIIIIIVTIWIIFLRFFYLLFCKVLFFILIFLFPFIMLNIRTVHPLVSSNREVFFPEVVIWAIIFRTRTIFIFIS